MNLYADASVSRSRTSHCYILIFQDNGNKLVWRTGYYVDWDDDVKPKAGLGPLPAYVIGMYMHLNFLKHMYMYLNFLKQCMFRVKVQQ